LDVWDKEGIMGAGIDYSNGKSNFNPETGIHFGVISQNEVIETWADNSNAIYPSPQDIGEIECPECGFLFTPPEGVEWGDMVTCLDNEEHEFELESPDFDTPLAFVLDDGEYEAQCGDDGDIFITKSPYYTLCRFCSPCAPGAGYLLSPDPDGIKAYCFGHDWFEGEKAPYPVYRVESGGAVWV
jgi:hypothetical protein